MLKTATITVRMDPQVKHGAEAVFRELGLTASQAIALFYQQVVLTQSIPFPLRVPGARPAGSASPEFLYRIQPARPAMLAEGPTPEEAAIIEAHFAYLQQAVRAGVVLLAGRTLNTDPSSFGIVILRATSEDEARAFMGADPAVRAGVMRAELHPYRVALLAEEWQCED